MSKWVKISDRLPNFDEPVMVSHETWPEQLSAAILRSGDDGWYWEQYCGLGMDFRDQDNYEFDDDYIYTCWHPFPEPPAI